MMEIAAVLDAISKGGNAAMFVCVYFIWKCEQRLARIEAKLDIPHEAERTSRNG